MRCAAPHALSVESLRYNSRMAKGERELVRWLGAQFAASPLRAPLGIGDDMAAIQIGGGLVLVTTDMLMDGVDFLSDRHTPEQIGRKALAAGLSDCAAMAVRPVAATVSLALPNSWSQSQAEGLYRGMKPLLDQFGVSLVGGDTNSWDGGLVVDVCVFAQAWAGIPPVTRSGARVGDGLYVSGRLGGSILGRHLDFEPRVTLARRLATEFGQHLHAMMDLSDGLLLDLSRMCEASGVGAEIDAEALRPQIAPAAGTLAAQDGRTPLDHALSDGEDFELLCAIADGASREPSTGSAATGGEVDVWPGRPIGRIVETGMHLVHVDRRREAVAPRGWEHFRNGGGQ